MITHLRGQLISKTPGKIVIEAGGLGYELSVSLNAFLALPEVPAEVFMYTRLFIREEAWDLYGFITPLERESFLALTSVNRIGPKLALTIVSALEPGDLARALMTKDLGTIASIKGIGAKTAERLMVELKDKAPKLAAMAGLSAGNIKEATKAGAAVGQEFWGEEDDAVSALVNLGYTPAEARKAVDAARQEVGEDSSLSIILPLALKNLTKPKP